MMMDLVHHLHNGLKSDLWDLLVHREQQDPQDLQVIQVLKETLVLKVP